MQRPEPFVKEIIATPADFTASSEQMKIVGVFNPGVTTVTDAGGLEKILLMIRVCEMPVEESDKYVLLPYFPVDNSSDSPFQIEFDKESKRDLIEINNKHVILSNSLSRLRHISYPVKAVSADGVKIDSIEKTPSLYPCYEHERFGIEDPRITKLVNPYDRAKYVITIVSPHRHHGVSTSIITTNDFKTFERHPFGGSPLPTFPGVKDIVLFPEKIPSPYRKDSLGSRELEFAALTRFNAFSDISNPTIWIAYSPNLMHWGEYFKIETSEADEISGTGAAVVGLEDMWIGPYHIAKTEKGKSKKSRRYYGALLGLKKDEPHKLLYRSPILIRPNEFDIEPGFIPDVVYPSGFVARDGIAYIYSGEDDTYVSVRKYYLEDLVKFLKEENINGH